MMREKLRQNTPRESKKGAEAPFLEIRSGGMYAARRNGTLLPASQERARKARGT